MSCTLHFGDFIKQIDTSTNAVNFFLGVQISSTILNEIFHGFPWSLLADTAVVPQIRLASSATLFPIYYLLIILPFNAM
jgi:hypothetical protein